MKTAEASGRWLPARECAALLGISVGSWHALWRHHPELARSVRRIRVNPAGRGVRRWPETVIRRWIEEKCK